MATAPTTEERLQPGPFDPSRLYSIEGAAQVLELEPRAARRLAERERLEVLRFTPKMIRLRGDQLAELVERAAKRGPDRRGCVRALPPSPGPERAA
jgi:hypothetical protein